MADKTKRHGKHRTTEELPTVEPHHAPPPSPRLIDFCRLSAVLDDVAEAIERGE